MDIQGFGTNYLKLFGLFKNNHTGRYESRSSLLDYMGGSGRTENPSEQIFQIMTQDFQARVEVNKMLLKDRLAADLEAAYREALAANPELEGKIVVAVVADQESGGLSVEVLRIEDVLANIEDPAERAEAEQAFRENPIYFVDSENISMTTPDDGAFISFQKTMADFITAVKPIIEYINAE